MDAPIDFDRLFYIRDMLALVSFALAASVVFNWHIWLRNIHLPEIKLPRIEVGSLALPAIMLVAAVLRLIWMTHDALWYDEAFTAMLADMPVGKLIAVTAADVHPPLLYLVTKAFTIFGHGEFAMRLPSALLGILAVWLAWLVLREIAGERVAIIGAGILAISPFAIYYSNEARMYSLLLVEILVVLLGAIRRHPFMVIVGLVLALLTHNMAVLYLPVIGIMIWRRSGFRHAVLTCGAAVEIWALLWLPAVAGQMTRMDTEGYWIQMSESITFAHWLHEIQSLLFGPFFPHALILPLNSFFASLFLIAPLVEAVHRRDEAALTLAGITLVPALGMLAISLIWQPMALARPLIGILPAWFGLIAWWVLLPRRWDICRISVVGLAAAVLIVATGTYYASDRAPYIRPITTWLRNNWKPGDTIMYATPADYIAIGANAPEIESAICVEGTVGAPFDVITRQCATFSHALFVVVIGPRTEWVKTRADELVKRYNGQLLARFGDDLTYASVYDLAGGQGK